MSSASSTSPGTESCTKSKCPSTTATVEPSASKEPFSKLAAFAATTTAATYVSEFTAEFIAIPVPGPY